MRLVRRQGRGLSRRIAVAFAWVSGSFALGSGGCSGDGVPAGTGRALADGCLINSDCNSPLVCAFRRCHTECKTTRDCAPPLRCVASDRPFHVCQLDIERSCTRNSDCPEAQICASDSQCRDTCATNRDCVTGQVCVSRACAEDSEVVGGKLPGPTNGSPEASAGLPCSYNSDCADPLSCLRG